VVNKHKSAAHADWPDGGTGKTCLGWVEVCNVTVLLVMTALRSRCGHYNFAVWFLLSSFYFFFFLA